MRKLTVLIMVLILESVNFAGPLSGNGILAGNNSPTAGQISNAMANDSNYSFHDRVVIATSYATAPSSTTSQNNADYVCDGSDDNVQIQAAIDSLSALGGEVYLCRGTYNISSTIHIRPKLKLTGDGVQSTSVYLAENSECDMLDDQYTGNSNGAAFIEIDGIFFAGNEGNQITNEETDDVESIDTDTEYLTLTGHPFDTGWKVRLATTDTLPAVTGTALSGGQYWVYKVSADEITLHYNKTDAATGASPINFTDSGAGTLTIDSGLNFFNCNGAGAGAGYFWDTYIHNIMVMYTRGSAIRCKQMWGWVISDTVIEYCGDEDLDGDGNVAHAIWYESGSPPKIKGCKLMENNGAGLFMEAGEVEISVCQIVGSKDGTYGGIHLLGGNVVMSSCSFSLGYQDPSDNNYYNMVGCYLQGGSSISSCGFFGAAEPTSNDTTKGVVCNSSNNKIVGCDFIYCDIGIDGASTSRTVCSGNALDYCDTGIDLGSNSNVVGNVFSYNTLGIDNSSGQKCVITGNTFFRNDTALTQTYQGIVSSNFFDVDSGQTGISASVVGSGMAIIGNSFNDDGTYLSGFFGSASFHGNIAEEDKFFLMPGDVITIADTIQHSEIVDGGGTTGYVTFAQSTKEHRLPIGTIVESVRIEFVFAFKDTVGNNSEVKVQVGDNDESDIDRWTVTADGVDIWNSTTTLYWDKSDFVGAAQITAQEVPRITFTVDSDITDLISGTGHAGQMNVYITYRVL